MYLFLIILFLILVYYYQSRIEQFYIKTDKNNKWDIPINKNFDVIKNEYDDRYRKQNILSTIDKNLKQIDNDIVGIKKFIPDNSGLDSLTQHTRDSNIKMLEKPKKIEKDMAEDNSTLPNLDNLRNRYKDYQYRECDFTEWIENPERCKAAKKYNKDLETYITEDLKESQKEFGASYDLHKNIPDIDTNIYPINNFDFNYKRHAKNTYNIYTQGITNRPTVNSLEKNTEKLSSFIDVLHKDEFIGDTTVSGVTDIIVDNKDLVYLKTRYNQLNSTLPYPSFRKDFPEDTYPTKGRYSTSYFLRNGNCSTSIKSEKECNNKGYTWTTKNNSNPECIKPRFMYLDNSAKSDNVDKRGLFSEMKDELNLISKNFYNYQNEDPINLQKKIGLLPCIDS